MVAGLAQPVERLIRNHEVASSNLASSSKTAVGRTCGFFQNAGVMEW